MMQVNKIVSKPWGEEVWICVNEFYALKQITLLKNHRTSLQYHDYKVEHSYLLSGKIQVESRDGQKPCVDEYVPGDVWHFKPKEIHRVVAMEDSVFIEVSTPHLDDVIRVEDDYKR
jgi:mannose-6-phosphate isomerase